MTEEQRRFARIVRLRRRLGVDPTPFSPVSILDAPPNSQRRWYERLAELQRLEEEAYSHSEARMLELESLALLLDL